MENSHSMAIGEEASRGTKEATTIGWIPLASPSVPKLEFEDKVLQEFRGQETVLGGLNQVRMSQKWAGTIEWPFFTEAGTTKGIVGTLIKHFFGSVTTAQQGATDAYAHMMYPVADPFATGNLGTKALTLNTTMTEGTVEKNWPFVGGRVSSISFDQEGSNHLVCSMELFGQFRDPITAEVGSEVYPAENLRCDYNNLSVYTGTPAYTGSAPDYTEIDASAGTRIKPDKISVKIENGMEDVIRLSGLDYPDKTRMGVYKATFELTIDWEDPASGFSSVDEFTAWVAAASEAHFTFVWDTGTEAGTAYNHKLVLDIPRAARRGGDPEIGIDKDGMITLAYEALYDPTQAYLIGCLLQNSAVTV